MENELLMSLLPTWHSLSAATDIHAPELLFPSGDGQSTGRFFTSFWEMSTESNGGLAFDSAISSLASSPVSPPSTSNDGFLIREMIGKLRSSGELLPRSHGPGHPYNEGAHKLANSTSPTYPGRPTDLSQAERLPSLGFQSFRGCSGQFAEPAALGTMMSRASSSPSLRQLGPHMGDPQRSKNPNPNPNPALQDRAKLSNSQESSVSNLEKNQGLETDAKAASEANWRKREAAPTRQEVDTEGDMGSKRVKQSDGGNGNENGHSKAEEEATGGGSDHGKYEKLQSKSEVKPPEPPKDYIHVRARRGQATDSHSLAERVRREKISERMKILQNLVPGCNKVTGKALMLDEIINYVQSLQRQVEFLSMKLAAVNTGTEINTNDPMAKDVLQSESTDPRQMLPVDSSSSALCGQKCAAVNLSSGAILQHSMDPLENAQFLAYRAFLGDDLQSIVQMGFGQN